VLRKNHLPDLPPGRIAVLLQEFRHLRKHLYKLRLRTAAMLKKQVQARMPAPQAVVPPDKQGKALLHYRLPSVLQIQPTGNPACAARQDQKTT
jgi:hypothetical protein